MRAAGTGDGVGEDAPGTALPSGAAAGTPYGSSGGAGWGGAGREGGASGPSRGGGGGGRLLTPTWVGVRLAEVLVSSFSLSLISFYVGGGSRIGWLLTALRPENPHLGRELLLAK